MSTKRQKSAVRFCEKWCNVVFQGDINKSKECSAFLTQYLREAKKKWAEEELMYDSIFEFD